MNNDQDYLPSGGADFSKDTKDERDFHYSDVMGAGLGIEPDWDAGYDAYEDLGLTPFKQDQNGSRSCVGQGTAAYVRRWLYKLGLIAADAMVSARRIYAKIFLPGTGGAVIADGVGIPASEGSALESEVPSYQNGNPPTEAFMRTLSLTPEQLAAHKKLDKFTRRMIPGGTSDINIFAHAIRNNLGVVGGFTMTNNGWVRSVVRAPMAGENQDGHCVDLCAFGKLDVDITIGSEVVPKGTKCLFTPNSWGWRYTITQGRWKGRQAVPESYFKAYEMNDPATGQPALGMYVAKAWVLVPDDLLAPGQDMLDFLKKNDLRLAQNSQGDGSFALIKGGKLLIAVKERVPELIATWAMKNNGSCNPTKQMWDAIVTAGLSSNF